MNSIDEVNRNRNGKIKETLCTINTSKIVTTMESKEIK